MTDLRPVLHDDGTPVMSSGNFAVVFKMKDKRDGKLYAVKCFTREQEERAENYRMIAEELGKVSSPYITPVKWLDGELFVDTTQTDETEFPVLLMDWIEGPTLSAFLQSIADQLKAGKVFKDNEYEMFELRCLPANFLRMASWLLKQPFAHGDLKPDNIIVREDGYCVLVDYDGMYVPAMQGMPQTCMGTPNFTHPSQTEHTLNKDIDSYAIAVIAISLQVFALRPSLIGESPEFCVITKQQALKLHTVSLLIDEDLMIENNIRELLSLFLHTLSQNRLPSEYFECTISEIFHPKDYDCYDTGISDAELSNCYVDKYGVKYSIDGRKVLTSPKDSVNIDYMVREGTLIVCDGCFFSAKHLHSVHLPDSVVSIGGAAFAKNDEMEYCNIPKSVDFIHNNNPWRRCFNIKLMKCDSPYYTLENGVLYSVNYRVLYGIIYWHSKVLVNSRTRIIAQYAFSGCKFQSISIPDSVATIGPWAFGGCSSLQNITLPSSVTTIGENAFNGCKSLQNVTIPNSVMAIGPWAFGGCSSLQNITLPSSVTTIGENAFAGCKSLQSVTIPDSVTTIESWVFGGCESLQSVTIPNSITTIGNNAFAGCKSLPSVTIPDSVTTIGPGAFFACESLQNVTIPDSITAISFGTFMGCKSLQSVTIPDSVTTISSWAFRGCKSLQSIYVPLSDIKRFKAMLSKRAQIIAPIP